MGGYRLRNIKDSNCFSSCEHHSSIIENPLRPIVADDSLLTKKIRILSRRLDFFAAQMTFESLQC